MNDRCDACQEALVELGGRVEELPVAVRDHLAECDRCRQTAVTERRLADLLAHALPGADPALVEGIVASLPARVRRWRVAALLPVAASLLLALTGVTLLGGVPGSSLLAALPSWSAHGLLALAQALANWGVVIDAVVRTAGAALPHAAGWIAFALAGIGLAAGGALVLRWRRVVTRW